MAGPARKAPRDTSLLRILQLLTGLASFGFGIALMARANLGLGPWSVLHDGIARHTGLSLGTVDILISVPLLLLWWPLGERPGLGTISASFVIGVSTNQGLDLLPPLSRLPARVGMAVAGVAMIAIGSGLYLAAGLGPGTRDGLMTGLHKRYGWSIRVIRTTMEVLVLCAGFLLGGSVGVGTLLYAAAIGPLVQLSLRMFDQSRRVMRIRP